MGWGATRSDFSRSSEVLRRTSARDGGEVERVELEPLPTLTRDGRRALAAIVGRSLALWSWLGVSDLHWENLVLGVGRSRPRGVRALSTSR